MIRGISFVCAALVTFLQAHDANAEKPAEPVVQPGPPGGDVTGFWGGQVAGKGNYSGRLVCLRSDQKFAVTGPAEDCPSGRRVYALERADGAAVHPLLATNEQMMSRFDAMRGRVVSIEGKLYEATGMILVSAITDEGTPDAAKR